VIQRQRDRELALQRIVEPPREARVQSGLREQPRQQQAAGGNDQRAK
jgi:hypothetical protein